MNAEDSPIDTRFWDARRGIVRSRNGGWRVGVGVFCHGYNLMEELVGKISYAQLLVLNVTGRLPDRAFGDWLEGVFMCMSYPDPRIWCNQIGALAGSLRCSPIAATAAGVQASFSRIYGAGVLLEGGRFIRRALEQSKQGLSVPEIVAKEAALPGGKPILIGYARPVAKGDERIEALERVAVERGFERGEHLRMADRIDRYLQEHYDERINFGGYAAAFFADQGYAPEESEQILATLVASGVTACHVDAAGRPPESFLPLRCDDIDYQGKPPRTVPTRAD